MAIGATAGLPSGSGGAAGSRPKRDIGEDGHSGSEGGKRPGKMAGDLRVSVTSIRWQKGEVKLVAGWKLLALDLCAGTRATSRRAPVLGVMLCYQCLEILDNFFNKGGSHFFTS